MFQIWCQTIISLEILWRLPVFFVFHCCNEVLRSHNVPVTSSADRNINFENCCGCLLLFCFFSIRIFFHGLTTHRTAGELKGPSFIPLYHFHPLMNIQIYICNFACEMTIIFLIAPLVFTRLLLDNITLSNHHLNDWWCDVNFCLLTWWFESRFLLQIFEIGNRWPRTRIDYHPCITKWTD